MLATRVAGGYGLKRPSANQVPDRNTDARGQLKPRHDVTPIAKFAELLVLGLIVGLFSLVLSFLWKGYSYKASDLIEYLTVEIPHYFPAGHPQEPVTISIDFCRYWGVNLHGVGKGLQ